MLYFLGPSVNNELEKYELPEFINIEKMMIYSIN